MNSPSLTDQKARVQALDITQSFIVQAPAGSGKTELLTQRYLKLLSISEQPEEVLAITFTRKAASEMRDRIIEAISWAGEVNNAGVPASELEQQRFEIASRVIERDTDYNWQLLENSSRLRVQTIDSFCSYLASQMPVLSRLGGGARVSEDIEVCFEEAIVNTLAELESGSELSDDIARLLQHLDNDVNQVQRLLSSLLHKRDQWLSYVLDIASSSDGAKAYLQQSLDELIEESLLEARVGLLAVEPELVVLVNFAADNLQRADKLRIADFEPLTALPPAQFESMPYWLLLVEMLLTKTSSWRKSVDIRNGFPAGDKQDKTFDALCKARKKQFSKLRESLSSNDDLLIALDYLRLLPNPAYEQQQWDFLAALTRLLMHLSGQLLLAFRKFRLIDYSQASASARAALGTEQEPTDLALALDHKIQHILVDEFQDTSQLQLEILEQLTHGWEAADGRTLFLVGDAMQSVYGFRNANVGIYLEVQQRGLGMIALQPLTLQSNFRSQGNLVSWVNQIFAGAFPQHANSSRGAVPYTPSTAVHDADDSCGVRLEIITHEPDQRQAARLLEAERIVAAITTIRDREPDASIAVLVRSRAHLSYLIPGLREANIQWQSTDIDRMESLPVVEDLLSLTQALLSQADRLAWLSILRAPWCGLNVADLHAIETHAGADSIWSALQRLPAIGGLSTAGRQRLEDFTKVIGFAMAMRYRQGLRQLVEASWTLLRGSCTARSTAELDSAAHFFSLLEQHETAGGLSKLDDFRNKVSKSFVPSTTISEAQPTIQLLTMHKAKGLEFDHVILPGLGNTPGSDGKPLLQWHQRLNRHGESRLFIAALAGSGADEDLLYQLLRHEQQHRTDLESTRLLYIAITRARRSVQLFATVKRNSKGEAIPAKYSLLSRVWRELNQHPATINEIDVAQVYSSLGSTQSSPMPGSDYPAPTPISRFEAPLRLTAAEAATLLSQTDDLSPPDASATVHMNGAIITSSPAEPGSEAAPLATVTATSPPAEHRPEADPLAAVIGTLIHRSLEALVSAGNNLHDALPLDNMQRYWRGQLQHLQLQENVLQESVQFIEQSVLRSVTHDEYGWVFDAALQDSQCELMLTKVGGGGLRHSVVDRSFIDQHDVRWIIDYKTGKPAADQSEEDFIATQGRLHGAQLTSYRNLFASMERRPIRTALFFTSLPRLVEFNPGERCS